MLIAKRDLLSLIFDIEAPVEEKMSIRRQTIWRHSRGDKSVVCKHWLRGLCKKNDECEFLHEYDLAKMPPCHFFINFGKCSNPECLFLHLKQEERIKDCPWYNRGFCKHGPNCKNRHVRKQACPRYLAGFCIDGPNCKLGHAKYELPEEDEDEDEVKMDDGEEFAPVPTIEDEDGTAIAEGIEPGRRRGKHHRTPLLCGICGASGHGSSFCNYSNKIFDTTEGRRKRFFGGRSHLRPLAEVTCFKCGMMGHYANVCINRRKAPPPGGYMVPSRVPGMPDKPAQDRFAKRLQQQSGQSTTSSAMETDAF